MFFHLFINMLSIFLKVLYVAGTCYHKGYKKSIYKSLSMVVHAFKPGAQKAETDLYKFKTSLV